MIVFLPMGVNAQFCSFAIRLLYLMYIYVHPVNVRAFVGAWMVHLVHLVHFYVKTTAKHDSRQRQNISARFFRPSPLNLENLLCEKVEFDKCRIYDFQDVGLPIRENLAPLCPKVECGQLIPL